MKTLTIKLILSLVFLVALSACSSGGGNDISVTNKDDIVLIYGESVSCSDKSSFSIEPLSGTTPNVTFQTNATTGVTTITYESIEGSATVVGCETL